MINIINILILKYFVNNEKRDFQKEFSFHQKHFFPFNIIKEKLKSSYNIFSFFNKQKIKENLWLKNKKNEKKTKNKKKKLKKKN